jgi:hypothetical protein
MGDLNAGPAKLKDNSKGSIVHHLGPLLTEIKKDYMSGDLNAGPAKLKKRVYSTGTPSGPTVNKDK